MPTIKSAAMPDVKMVVERTDVLRAKDYAITLWRGNYSKTGIFQYDDVVHLRDTLTRMLEGKE
jgi:muconolactone delta-isomerase